jgi:hypothetical protein
MTSSYQRRAALVVPAAVSRIRVISCSSAFEWLNGCRASTPGTSFHGIEMSVFGTSTLEDVQVAVAVIEVVTVAQISEVSR